MNNDAQEVNEQEVALEQTQVLSTDTQSLTGAITNRETVILQLELFQFLLFV